MQWDLFCRVIDNYGDIGVCWRLAADLGARGEQVRLWVDDPTALDWMAPSGAPGVEVHGWREDLAAWPEPGDVVVEAFGCDPPEPFVARMAARRPAPAWINLEYLSAQDYVERSHRLASPCWSGPGSGLTKHFFYPGFTPRTGGLLREPGLMAKRAGFDRHLWLAAHGAFPRDDEQIVSLFCYDNPALPALLRHLLRRPTLLLVTPGLATRQVAQALGVPAQPGGETACDDLRVHWLNALPQPEFDRLLWACDLNLVRGEDSFVRAQWAGRPFLWHIYPQDDGAHAPKLEAFLNLFLAGADPDWADRLRTLWLGWNGLPAPAADRFWSLLWPEPEPWQRQALCWREQLLAQDDLSTQLCRFVLETR